MFCNVTNYVKLLRMARSCLSKTHVKMTFDLATKFRSSCRLTEFEYLEVEKTLLERLKVDPSISRWNNTIDVEEQLKKSTIHSDVKIKWPLKCDENFR